MLSLPKGNTKNKILTIPEKKSNFVIKNYTVEPL